MPTFWMRVYNPAPSSARRHTSRVSDHLTKREVTPVEHHMRLKARSTVGCILLLGCALVPTLLFGSITQIQMGVNQPPVAVGRWASFQATTNGSASNWHWYRRCTIIPAGQWQDYGGGSSANLFLGSARVGSYTIKVTDQEMVAGPPPTFQNFELTKDYNVIGPDSDTIIDGLNVPSTSGSLMPLAVADLTVKFQMKCGQTLIGDLIAGYVQESIRRPQSNFDSGWTGETADFRFSPPNIEDHKTVGMLVPEFANAAVGAVFDDFFQQNRFVIEDCHGYDTYFYFPERHFRKIKLNSTTWKLIEI